MNQEAINSLRNMGFNGDIAELEEYIDKLQNAAGNGTPLVDDSIYDAFVRALKDIKPESKLLNRNWETDDNELDENDELLERHSMYSINTITDYSELNKFNNRLGTDEVDLTASVKENGHAVRAVYKYGKQVGGSTRGRYKKGRDIKRHLSVAAPQYVPQWEDIRLVEVRGEILVSLKNFELLKDKLKTPLSSVTSLIRDSVTDSELQLLDFVAYRIYHSGEIEFDSYSDELDYLHDCGFKIPQWAKIPDVNRYNLTDRLDDCLRYFEQLYNEGKLEYATDGIVVVVDDYEQFYSMGMDGNSYLGNFALKMGDIWESNVYSSEILEIEWVYGKSFITPKAVIRPIKTVTGQTVDVVPLHNVSVIERFNYVPGRTIYFKFGGESGVKCCSPTGELVGERQ